MNAVDLYLHRAAESGHRGRFRFEGPWAYYRSKPIAKIYEREHGSRYITICCNDVSLLLELMGKAAKLSYEVIVTPSPELLEYHDMWCEQFFERYKALILRAIEHNDCEIFTGYTSVAQQTIDYARRYAKLFDLDGGCIDERFSPSYVLRDRIDAYAMLDLTCQ